MSRKHGQGEGFRATVNSSWKGWEDPPAHSLWSPPGPGWGQGRSPGRILGPWASWLLGSHRDSGACLHPEPTIPSALSPNAVNGFSQLLNRQLPPALAASCFSRGACPRQPRALRALAPLLAARAGWLRFLSCLWGRPPVAEPASVSASQAAPRLWLPGGLPPLQPASEWGPWPGRRSGPCLSWEGRWPTELTHSLTGGSRAEWT